MRTTSRRTSTTLRTIALAAFLAAACGPTKPEDGERERCEHSGESHLAPTLGAPIGSEAEVEIESCGGDERFKVRLEGVPPGTYTVCVHCDVPPTCPCPTAKPDAGVRAASLARRGAPRPALVQPVLSMPETTIVSGFTVDLPVRLTADESVSFAQFTVEWDNTIASLTAVLLGSAASAAGFLVDVNPMPPFAARPGTNDNASVQLHHPMGTGSLLGNRLEIALLRFHVVGTPGTSTPVRFDGTPTGGRERTFLTLPGRDVVGETEITLDDGRIDVLGLAPGCTVVGTIVVRPDDDDDDDDDKGLDDDDDDGSGRLCLKTSRGDVLPCGVPSVCLLQGKPIEIHDAATDSTLFSGLIPCFDDDDDDDDDDDGDDDDGDDDLFRR